LQARELTRLTLGKSATKPRRKSGARKQEDHGMECPAVSAAYVRWLTEVDAEDVRLGQLMVLAAGLALVDSIELIVILLSAITRG
jgi:hypothetical protein